jgi:hypothetical protein
LDCGDRSRQSFIKALDVWSEYAACRSAAEFRPDSLEDFDEAFCIAINEKSRGISEMDRKHPEWREKAMTLFERFNKSLATPSSALVTCSGTHLDLNA